MLPQVLGVATVRVRASKTAIHTNGLQREQDSNSGSKTPSPSRTGDANSPDSQLPAHSRHPDRHPEVAQQSAQLRNHGQTPTSGSPPVPHHSLAPQQAMQMEPSAAEIQQHLMAKLPPGMMHQQPQQQQYTTNGAGYPGAAGSMPMVHAPQPPQFPQQHSGYKQAPPRPSGTVTRSSNQNYAPTPNPSSGLGLKRGYDDVQQGNAGAAAAAAAFLNQQQQADDKRMRMSH